MGTKSSIVSTSDTFVTPPPPIPCVRLRRATSDAHREFPTAWARVHRYVAVASGSRSDLLHELSNSAAKSRQDLMHVVLGHAGPRSRNLLSRTGPIEDAHADHRFVL